MICARNVPIPNQTVRGIYYESGYVYGAGFQPRNRLRAKPEIQRDVFGRNVSHSVIVHL